MQEDSPSLVVGQKVTGFFYKLCLGEGFPWEFCNGGEAQQEAQLMLTNPRDGSVALRSK